MFRDTYIITRSRQQPVFAIMAGSYLALLTPSTLAYSAITLLILYILIGGLVNYRKLSHIKGPPLASFSRAYMYVLPPRTPSTPFFPQATHPQHLPTLFLSYTLRRFYQSLNARVHTAQFLALKRYGSPVVRLAPNLLITDDADIIRHMSAPRSGWTRGPWYNAMAFDLRGDTVFSTRDEKVSSLNYISP